MINTYVKHSDYSQQGKVKEDAETPENQFSLIDQRVGLLDRRSQDAFKRYSEVFMDILELKQSRKRAKDDLESAKLVFRTVDDELKEKTQELIQIFEEEYNEEEDKKQK